MEYQIMRFAGKGGRYKLVGKLRTLKDKNCKFCKKRFRPNNIGRQYCSYPCAVKGRYNNRKGKIVPCKTCGKKFYVSRYRLNLTKFCSYKCSWKGREKKKIKRKCRQCGKVFYRQPSQEYWRGKGKFCSAECMHKGRKASILTVDDLWSKLVKLKAGNKCEYCGKTDGLNSHHLFSRTNRVLRWNENNGVCLCVYHHIFGVFSAHKAPIEFIEWLREKRGEGWYTLLREQAKVIIKGKLDLERIKRELQDKLSVFES
jgi:hypothetical protein